MKTYRELVEATGEMIDQIIKSDATYNVIADDNFSISGVKFDGLIRFIALSISDVPKGQAITVVLQEERRKP